MNDEAFAGQCGAKGLGCLAGGKLDFFPTDGGGPDAEPFGIGAQVIGIVQVVEFLELVDLLGAPVMAAGVQAASVPAVEEGAMTPSNLAAIISELLPENAIVSDEGGTAGGATFFKTAGAKQHDWLMLTGGAIGQGLPVAVGAAVACPDRKVIALQGDGAGMYTCQALWTMARENLDVTTIVLKNGRYAILNIELKRVGVQRPGPKALSMLDLGNPQLDWVQLSQGMGVAAERATTTAEFRAALSKALLKKGPSLVEVVI
jgi:acetolactate synthase-1/2/3 large subunit